MRPSRNLLAMLLLGLSIAAPTAEADAQGGAWATRASLPTPRTGVAVGVVNGILYAVGGANADGFSSAVEAYDPVTDTWVARAPMPTPRYAAGAAVANGLLYVIGGSTTVTLATVEAYDPVTDTWAARTSMPTARDAMGVGTINGIIYVAGGESSSAPALAALEAYDPVTDSWTSRTPMPTARYGVAAGVVNGLLHIIGGSPAFATVEAYDPLTDTWSTRAPITTSRFFPAASELNGRLYVAGGQAGSQVVGTMESYDPAANGWTSEPAMPSPRMLAGAGVVNSTLYLVGGQDCCDPGAGARVEAFTPAAGITIACAGFEPPFDRPIQMKRQVQRAIPLKIQLRMGPVEITDQNLPGAPPVVSIGFSAGSGPAVDVTDALEPVGHSSIGNAFRFDPAAGHWTFNLGTQAFSTAGSYAVTALSGGGYTLAPSCSGQFMRSN